MIKMIARRVEETILITPFVDERQTVYEYRRCKSTRPSDLADLGLQSPAMPYYLDLETWPRREVFEFYRRFDKPYFNVCLRLDVTNLLGELRKRQERPSAWLTYHYLALR